MTRRYLAEQEYDITTWRDLGPDAIRAAFLARTRAAASAGRHPAPPDTVTVTWQRHTRSGGLLVCDEADADTVTLTLRWET
jgi:hypothetical protein